MPSQLVFFNTLEKSLGTDVFSTVLVLRGLTMYEQYDTKLNDLFTETTDYDYCLMDLQRV